ncbi:uncharacterized protein AB675_11729 [Cyphellophora attinorum]|uniref:DNA mismatch repair protein MSH3 n=1 Tax=Cyphellophora attinorum TaxID=1664694 RepID=A0A0N0NIG7_9EURO|nr:uncharacterized protein AB675_11729 [Phialophora attinorum]KPI35419.1 hypothetical protein AB675_11729 [Phialophora attinorum]
MHRAAASLIVKDVSHLLRASGARPLLGHVRSASSTIIKNARRGAKTKATKKASAIASIQQGALEPLQDIENEEEVEPDYPSYPDTLQGVRDNMAKFKNCVVVTRVGNFYEMYFDQAAEFGPAMSLKVSYRMSARHPAVPMAGFPFYQLDRYLKTLVQELNQHVAICEEFPNNVEGKIKSGGNRFDRKVVRVVTPGTLIDENFMDTTRNNFLLAVHVPAPTSMADGEEKADHDVGLAWIDLSTGDFWTGKTPRLLLASSIARISAREIVLQDSATADVKNEIQALLGQHHELASYHNRVSNFDSLQDWNHCFETAVSADIEQTFSHQEKQAIHHLLDYAQQQLQRTQLRLQPPRQRDDSHLMEIDRYSLRGLEILETSRDGFGKGSLIHAIKKTVTSSGTRLLRERLVQPSASVEEISQRLDLVTAFIENNDLREDLIERLRRTFDVQRLVQKFTMNKGDPDDLVDLAKSIAETALVQKALLDASTGASEDSPLAPLTRRIFLQGPQLLAEHISNSIDEEGLMQLHRQEEDEKAEVTASAVDAVENEGADPSEFVQKNARRKARVAENRFSDSDMLDAWIMKRSASDAIGLLHQELDALMEERDALAARLQVEVEAKSLSLRLDKKGYICHIRSNKDFNKHALDELKANLISSTKSTKTYHLPIWSKLGGRMDAARIKIRNEEQRILHNLRQDVFANLVQLRRNAAVMDEIDVATSFAALAEQQGWKRPVVDTSTDHQIIGGRHPTVKLGLEEQGRTFISNDCVLDAKEQIWLVTGPNMAGKSTFLRQNALITILAQVGSYVPAEYARIGVVDRIFSRIGAADDLFRDQSTFMVEMLETAAILKQATARSFAIMDEVGRGTTPQDGIAVAFGILSHLHHINRCRTLFATHFHRLADLTASWPRIGRYCTDIIEEKSGSFIFQHQLKPGVNRNSHALKVAKLAGLPQAALIAARDMLDQLQMEDEELRAAASLPPPKPVVAPKKYRPVQIRAEDVHNAPDLSALRPPQAPRTQDARP